MRVELFTMPGCPSCVHAERTLTRLKAEMPDLEIASIDLTREPQRALQHRLLACPAVVIDGRLAFVGGLDERSLRKRLGMRPRSENMAGSEGAASSHERANDIQSKTRRLPE